MSTQATFKWDPKYIEIEIEIKIKQFSQIGV